jgi:hypothetical protein
MTSPTVLVVARHGTYAMELRRAGLIVVEASDEPAISESLTACVIEAVGSDTPAPPAWDRLVAMLQTAGAPPVFAVVSQQPPEWLQALAARAVLVSAPISGRRLAERVTAALGPLPSLPAPAKPADPPDDDVIDLGLEPAEMIELVGEMDRAAALAVHQRVAGTPLRRSSDVPSARGQAMPLRMARAGEVVDRLVDCLPAIPTLRDVCQDLADLLDERLDADVAVLVSRTPDAPWSVLAGIGLRPLEWRPVPRDPQVLSLLDSKRPILRIESSDDVRQSAGDLPCASRNHLLVARHPVVDLLVLAGREEGSFTRDDVRTLGSVLERMDGLDDALTLCALAERLLPYLDT